MSACKMGPNAHVKPYGQPTDNIYVPLTDQLSVCKVTLRFSAISLRMPSIQKDRKLCLLFLLSGGVWVFIRPPVVPKSPIRLRRADCSVTHRSSDNSGKKTLKKKKTTRNVWKTLEFKVTSLTRTGAVCQAFFPSDFQDLKGRGCNLWMDSATCSASWREASALYFFKGFMHTSLCLQYCFPGPSCINTHSDYWPLYIFFCRHTSLI